MKSVYYIVLKKICQFLLIFADFYLATLTGEAYLGQKYSVGRRLAICRDNIFNFLLAAQFFFKINQMKCTGEVYLGKKIAEVDDWRYTE